ncbi:cytochrome P450 2D4-like [Mercenaria mercenaria]|uniref:cytochrome P450 2D4-like n=1 Tax=Mercenaria mercenaria TaxID=6596 RepID=UPI00234F4B75|nr:cytochrome P450 2D4-like [Mercenaria mercenaria]
MVDVFLFGIFTVLAIFWILRKNGRKGRRIPGPKGLPLVGCVLEVKEENIHTKFSDYAHEYGDIFQFKLMNDTIIGLNSEHLIRLAYAQDGYKEYLNDKPATFYAEMLLYGSQSTEFCKDGYSAEHTAYRKGFTNVMKIYGAGIDSSIEEMFMTEIKRGLMKRIEDYNGKYFEIAYELKRSLANTLSCLFKGEPFNDNDPNASIFDEFCDCVDYFGNASVNNVLTTLPFLRYMPGPYGKQFAKALKTRETIIDIFFKEQKVRNTLNVTVHLA